MEGRTPKNEQEPRIKTIPLKGEWFDSWGVNPETIYTVEIMHSNEDLKGTPYYRGPDYGVIITPPGDDPVGHIIESHRVSVKPGDQVKFTREEPRH